MPRRNNGRRTRGGNRIQNVRVVDNDEARDSVRVSSILTSLSSSNQQIRVTCSYQGTLSPTGPAGGIVSLAELTSTDDWQSFDDQFTEYRVRAIQFRVFDVQPNSAATVNYWATYHQLGGAVAVSPSDIVDRPDARVLTPGAGWLTLDWAAHGQPEMEFQPVVGGVSYGGLCYNVSPAATITGTKYQIVAKFVVDFRGRT
jgi:hypothetical protein